MTWRNKAQAGFTLIEMIVVMAVIGLMVGIVVAKGPMRSRTLTQRAAVQAMSSGLREARARAVATNRPVEFAVDIEHKVFRVGDSKPIALPPEFAMSMVSAAGQRMSDTIAAIRFDPDGSSTGGRIDLATDNRHIRIGVDWLSGKVSVSNAK
jgi:general secretion pathway protein H